MRVPDMRPIEVLTPEILATASHWAILGNDIMDVRPTSGLKVPVNENPGLDADPPALEYDGENYWVGMGWSCYPCTLDLDTGISTPQPWPILPGEEEIVEWFGKYGDPTPYYDGDVGMGWRLYDEDDETWTSAFVPARAGAHPALRQDRCWVWEADKK